MRKLIIIISAISCFISSCKNSETKQLSKVDTTIILERALNSREFLKEEIHADTIFILKSKKYKVNDSWPKKTSYFTIEYIEDTSETRIINKGPRDPYDRRTRIGVPIFKLNKDTVDLSLVNFGISTSYKFKLIRDKQQKWIIVAPVGLWIN